MNLHNLHNDPKSLDYIDDVDMVPTLFCPAEDKRQYEKLWARNPKTACLYSCWIIKKPFPLGESAIAKEARYSYWYARDVLGAAFKLGEPAIATDDCYSHWYARDVLKKRFKLGEPAIKRGDAENRAFYESFIKCNL